MKPATVAYSYVRFSHPSQAAGDSLRRQTEAAARWCQEHGVRLDTATTFRDLGKSAYLGEHRKNPDRHALAAFLKLVEDGEVPRGSYLIIENLDRLSREHIQPALLLALNLLQAGVRVVQLKPVEMVFDDRSDTLPVMMMMMELSRGHGESAIKSERIGAAWAQKRKAARDSGAVLTRSLPAWVEVRGGKLHLIPSRAAAVEKIFALAAAGYGHQSILRQLAADKVPPFGRSGRWTRPYVSKLLHDRRVLGECQPRRRDGTPEGAPIPGYFPAAVPEALYDVARAGAAQRRTKRGRLGTFVNVFAGLMRDARDGEPYWRGMTTAGRGPQRPRAGYMVLRSRGSMESRGAAHTFSFLVFERALLSLLAEVDPRDVLGREEGREEVLALSTEYAQVEAQIAQLEVELLKGDIAAVARVLREREARKRELAGHLAEARQKAAHPLSEAWGEAKTLIDVLDNAPDPTDARLRLRSAVRRIVESVWLLVVRCGRVRLCAVQVWFADGESHRDYLIYHLPKANGQARQEGRWWARSLAEVAAPGDLDLRRRADARKLEAVLAALDPSE
jgi:DNA invertase Pin-like site-specific DNA recombinase